jgi:hypothetical protein
MAVESSAWSRYRSSGKDIPTIMESATVNHESDPIDTEQHVGIQQFSKKMPTLAADGEGTPEPICSIISHRTGQPRCARRPIAKSRTAQGRRVFPVDLLGRGQSARVANGVLVRSIRR